MRVLVSLEHRFLQTPDGSVYSPNVRGRDFWDRFRDAFDEIAIIARVRPIPRRQDDLVFSFHPRGSGRDVVSLYPLPDYRGLKQLCLRLPSVLKVARQAIDENQQAAMILRGPGPIASILWNLAVRDSRCSPRRPYSLEVHGDPWDVFGPMTRISLSQPLLRRAFAFELREQCRGATSVGYVTRAALQRRYPPGPAAGSFAYSDGALPSDAFSDRPRSFSPASSHRLRLVAVGTMSVDYKGFHVLLRALASLAESTRPELTIIGDGPLRRRYEQLAYGVLRIPDTGPGAVRFTGQLAGPREVRAYLDRSDLFVMPSLTEGLPRAMIEAMARGLPCLGSRVGGIPELLQNDAVFPPGNERALADLIDRVATDHAWLSAAAARNLTASREYADDRVEAVRQEHYRTIAASMDAHLRAGARA